MTKSRNKNFLPFLLMAPALLMLVLTAFGQLILAHADGASPDLPTALGFIFSDITTHAAAAVVIMHVFEVLKTNEVIGILGKIGLQGKPLQVAVAFITAFGFAANAYAKGESIVQALIEGLFTSGGAMLIYNAYQSGASTVADASAAAAVAPVANSVALLAEPIAGK